MFKRGTNKFGNYKFSYDEELDPPIWVEALSRVSYFTRKRMLKKMTNQQKRQERAEKDKKLQSQESIKAMEAWFSNSCFRLCSELATEMKESIVND